MRDIPKACKRWATSNPHKKSAWPSLGVNLRDPTHQAQHILANTPQREDTYGGPCTLDGIPGTSQRWH